MDFLIGENLIVSRGGSFIEDPVYLLENDISNNTLKFKLLNSHLDELQTDLEAYEGMYRVAMVKREDRLYVCGVDARINLDDIEGNLEDVVELAFDKSLSEINIKLYLSMPTNVFTEVLSGYLLRSLYWYSEKNNTLYPYDYVEIRYVKQSDSAMFKAVNGFDIDHAGLLFKSYFVLNSNVCNKEYRLHNKESFKLTVKNELEDIA